MSDTNPLRKSTSLPVEQLTVADGNWDTVRDYPIRMIVIHTIVGTVKSADIVFNSPRSQRSTHYGVGLDGKLYQWVDEVNVAYQAGKYAVNQYSIGIEHEDNGNYNEPRTDALYEASSKLVADIASFYHITLNRDHVRKHSEVSSMPTACPDTLDIDRIIRGAIALSAAPNLAPVKNVLEVSIDDWKGLLTEAGNLEAIASAFEFSQIDCKTDATLGNKVVNQIHHLQDELTKTKEQVKILLDTPPSPVSTQAAGSTPAPSATPPSSLGNDVKQNPNMGILQSLYEALKLIFA